MLRKLKNWLSGRPAGKVAPPRVATRKVPAKAPEVVDFENDASSGLKPSGPGQNVPAQRKFVREDSGTHETLKIFDDSIIETGQDDGADPYNTGGFDRSKNWGNRFSSK
jgi:hypothetical protein